MMGSRLTRMVTQLRWRSRTRLAVFVGSLIALLATTGVVATSGAASADSVVSVHYAVTGTTFIAKLNTTVNLGSGSLASTVDLTTGAAQSTLTLPPATAAVKEFGLVPVTATTVITQNGLASGTVNLSANTITSTANVTLKITRLTIFGISLPVGNKCQTSPFTISISSGPGFTVGGGGPVSGAYTIPAFHNCGINTLLLNLTIPGSGNTLNLTLGPLQLG
jgi:hypothetical protein